MAHAIFDEEYGKMLKYRALLTHTKCHNVWTHLSANEFSQPAQGVGTCIKGTNTIFFINKQDIPVNQGWNVMHGKLVCEFKPKKLKKEHTHFTI